MSIESLKNIDHTISHSHLKSSKGFPLHWKESPNSWSWNMAPPTGPGLFLTTLSLNTNWLQTTPQGGLLQPQVPTTWACSLNLIVLIVCSTACITIRNYFLCLCFLLFSYFQNINPIRIRTLCILFCLFPWHPKRCIRMCSINVL